MSITLFGIQAQEYCSILLRTISNVGSTRLFNPVVFNIEQMIILSRVHSINANTAAALMRYHHGHEAPQIFINYKDYILYLALLS